MTGFLLIHSPLVGPTTWSRVAGALRERGHAAAVPSLLGCETPPYWRCHVARAVEAAGALGDEPVVIVGHSGAGPLLPLIAEALAGRAEACIFVDAMLPTDGGSRMSQLPAEFAGQLRRSAVDGRLPRWGESWPESLWTGLIPDVPLRAMFRAELAATPLAMYTEVLPTADTAARAAYLQFSDAYEDEAASAVRRGWPFRRLAGGHLHMLVEPEAVAEALIGFSYLR